MTKFGLVVLALGISSCTDAQWSQVTSLGSQGKITCYSGGHVIYDGVSSGKISTEHSSDGWFFREASTGHLIRISGDCVVIN